MRFERWVYTRKVRCARRSLFLIGISLGQALSQGAGHLMHCEPLCSALTWLYADIPTRCWP